MKKPLAITTILFLINIAVVGLNREASTNSRHDKAFRTYLEFTTAGNSNRQLTAEEIDFLGAMGLISMGANKTVPIFTVVEPRQENQYMYYYQNPEYLNRALSNDLFNNLVAFVSERAGGAEIRHLICTTTITNPEGQKKAELAFYWSDELSNLTPPLRPDRSPIRVFFELVNDNSILKANEYDYSVNRGGELIPVSGEDLLLLHTVLEECMVLGEFKPAQDEGSGEINNR